MVFYPCYLYYKDTHILVLAYGVSETNEFGSSWPTEITSRVPTIDSYFKKHSQDMETRLFLEYIIQK